MILTIDSTGTILQTVPERVYQGSNNANTIYMVAPFPSNVSIYVSYTLPNGANTEPQLMTNFNGSSQLGVSIWTTTIDSKLTELFGNVTLQFTAYSSANEILCTGTSIFNVEKGIEPTLPSTPTQDIYNQILSALSTLQSYFVNGWAEAKAILQYDSEFSYSLGATIFDSATNDIYVSLIDNNIGNALTDTSAWSPVGIALMSTLQNYYTKSETYSQEQIDTLIQQVNAVQFQIVDELPAVGQPSIIYLVPSVDGAGNNNYDEYIWIIGTQTYEKIGSTEQISLDNYYTKAEIDAKISTLNSDIEELGSELNNTANDLTNEIANRQNADNELQTQITTNANNISIETSNRESADQTLQSSIDTVQTLAENAIPKSAIQNTSSNSTTDVYSAKYVQDNFTPRTFIQNLYFQKTGSTTANLVDTKPTPSTTIDNVLTATSTNTSFNFSTPSIVVTRVLENAVQLDKQDSLQVTLSVLFDRNSNVEFGANLSIGGVVVSSNQAFGQNSYLGSTESTMNIYDVTFNVAMDNLTEVTNFDVGETLTLNIFTNQSSASSLTTSYLCGLISNGAVRTSYVNLLFTATSIGTNQIADGSITMPKLATDVVDELNSFISYNPQTLTPEQQEQARTNIGANTSSIYDSNNNVSITSQNNGFSVSTEINSTNYDNTLILGNETQSYYKINQSNDSTNIYNGTGTNTISSQTTPDVAVMNITSSGNGLQFMANSDNMVVMSIASGENGFQFMANSDGANLLTNDGNLKVNGENVAFQTAVDNDLLLKENLSNKVTTIASTSTDTEYPSAKAVYDLLQTSIVSALGGDY